MASTVFSRPGAAVRTHPAGHVRSLPAIPVGLRAPLKSSAVINGTYSPLSPVVCSAAGKDEVETVCPVSSLAPKSAPEQPAREKKLSLLRRMTSTAMRLAAVIGVAATLALSNVDPAMAARSGGRVGGGGFSRSAPSRSYGGGSSSRGSVMTRSSPRTSTVYRSSVMTAPPVVMGGGYGYGMPLFSPFGGLGFGGPMVVTGGFGVSSLLSVMFFMMMAISVLSVVRGMSVRSDNTTTYDSDMEAVPPVTVAKVQVALLANARGLKRKLDDLAESANTSSSEGLHMMMQEAVLALLRYPEYCVSAYADSKTLRDESRAEGMFHGWSLEERSRVKEETLVNVRGRPVRANREYKDSGEVAEFIVVTLTVAAEGNFSLPAVRTPADLRTALSKLGAVAPHQLMAAEITWAPQADGDTLTQHDLVSTYPDLVPL